MPATPTNLVKMREQDALKNELRLIRVSEEIKRETRLRIEITELREQFAKRHNVPFESVQVIACTRTKVTLGA